MKVRILFFLCIFCLLLVSCDKRHNSKLPTGISPFDYIESNIISDSTNYLVRSTNDDSYIFINKTAISSSVLKKGDYLWFSHTQSFSARDSVAIADGMSPITDALYFYVYRDSIMIPMQFNTGMVKLFTKPLSALSNVKVLRFDEKYITSDHVTGIAMDKDNAVIPVSKTGFFQYYQQGEVSTSVEFTSNGQNFYAWHPDFSTFLPADTQWNEKHLKFTEQSTLTSTQQTQVETVFPSFAQTDKIITYELSAAVTTTLYPEIRMWKQPAKFTPQMVVFQPGTTSSMYSLDTVDDLWLDQVTYKDIYLKYQGTYCFVSPLSAQNQITIPLDGTLSQLYLNRLYLDLRGVTLSNGSLNIDLSNYSRTLPAIYNGTIFNVTDQKLPVTFSFMQNGSPLTELPDSLWIEVGISLPSGTDTSNQKWFGYHLDDSLEESLYYSLGTSYDATHYSVANQYLFFPLALSGLYFLGSDSNTSQSFTIPVIRESAIYQIRNMTISYGGAITANLSHYYLNLQPQVDLTQPIFQGKPYELSGTQAAFKAGFFKNNAWTDDVPKTHLIQYRNNRRSRSNHILIYKNTDDWQKTVLLTSGNQLDVSHFVQSGTDYTIGGIMGGNYILTNVDNLSSASIDFALYSHMYIDFGCLRISRDTDNAIPSDYYLRAQIDRYMPRNGRTLPAIFQGDIFDVNDPKIPVTLSYQHNGSTVTSLPDSLWMEVGISLPSGTDTTGQSWFGYHLDSTIEEEFYSTQATSYDASHYTVANQFLYIPLAVSGLYFLGSDSNTSQEHLIPVLRDAAYYQMPNISVSYAGAKTAGLSKYYLNLHPQVDLTQSIFQSKPYQLSNTIAAFRAGFYQGNDENATWTETVPSSHVIQYRSSRRNRSNHILIYSNTDNWQKVLLQKNGSQIDGTHFMQSGSDYTIGGILGGTYLLANVDNIAATNINFALYSHMYLDFDRVKLFHSSSDAEPTGYYLNTRIDNTFPDSRNIIQNQYQLQQTSWNYHITAYNATSQIDAAFLKQYQPVLYFATTQRNTPTLVHLNQDQDYRIYTYPQGTTLTAYNYISINGFEEVIPSYNGDYCSFSDSSPHTAITTLIHATTTELITSLYQAQFILPAFFVNTAFPVGYKINLSETTEAPVGTQLLSGYRLIFLDNNNNPIDLNLIQDYVTTNYPYMYLPFPPANVSSNFHVRYINALGVSTDYSRVTSFSGTSSTEFIVVGNCVVLPVNARGRYLISSN